MADKKFTLQFDAKMELSNIVGQLKVLQGQLEKMELPKDATKNFEKAFDKIGRDIAEFEIVAARGISSLADTKNVEKAWKQITKDLDGIGATLGSLDASKVFPKEVLQNIEKANGALDKYLSKLESTKKSQEYTSKVDARDKASDKQRVLQESLNKATQERTKKEANYVAKKSQWTDQIEQNYKDEQAAVAQTTKQLKDQIKIIESLEERKKELIKEGYLTSSGSVSATKRKEVTGSEDSGEKKKLAEAEDIGAQLSAAKNIKKDYEGMAKQAREAAKANQELKKSIETAEAEFNAASKDASSFSTQLKQAEQEVDNLNTELKDLETDKATEEWEELVALIKEITGIDLSGSVQDISKIQEALEKYQTDEIEKIPQILKDTKQSFQDTAPAVKNVEQALRDTANEVKELSRAEQEIENLKNQIFQFFSVTNAIQLFKRTVQSAINTVKELDAVMTETAVVTDFSVGDMWEKLPEYASHANALGASIKDVYAATTLYYQQGLQTNEAMGVGVETMKMARIANLDAGDATQYMTAALRGFNMEVNELNAQRVNDVYSELAAITAADTSQIATAMSKTASIASAANMEFETTAALLAQIIETTQEAPETAGTALKTIIARFSEVKKLREEGQTTGEDEEGEAIDVNKIQGALRTVGISMDNFFAGTEGLDSILLKLAEKWGSLDFETQRYIATMAAGSRQQSRFIAMMSDYERTMELATAANNSAGASQQQFDKTLESIEAKLQKLKNAWDEFAMGLANNEILKFGVDLLTGVLEAVNKLTEALSGGNGLIKSFVNLVAVVGALKGGSQLFGKLFGEGKIGIDFGNGQKGSISLFGGAKEKALKEGQEAGKSFNIGLQRAIQKGKEQGIKKGIGSLFGEIVEELDTNNKIDYLANAYEKNQENLNFDIGEVSLAFNKGGVEAANQAILDMGGNIDDLIPKIQTFKVDFQGIGTAAIGVGTAINLLGGLFEKLEMTEAAEAMQKIGTSITGIGTALMALGPLINMLGITVSSAGITIGAAGAAATLGWLPFSALLIGIVALIAGVTAGISWLVKNRTISGRLKEAEKATEKLNKATEETKQQYEELNSTLDSLEESYDKIQNLVYGTQEWREEVANTNQALLELADTYEGLSEFIKIGKNGVLYIDYNEENTEGYGAKDILGDGEQKQRYQRIASIGLDVYSKNLESEKQQKTLGGNIWGASEEGKKAFDALGEALARSDIQLVGTEDEIIDTLSSYLQRLDKNIYGENITDANNANTIATEIADQYLDDLKKYAEIEKTSDTTVQMAGIVSEALQQANLTTEQRGQFTNVIDTQRIQGIYDTELDRLEGLDTEAFKAEAEEYVKAIYGSTAKILDNGEVEYKDSEGNKQKVGRNDYEAQVAAIKAQEKASGYLEETAKALSGVSKQYQKEAKGLLTNQLTSKNLDNMGIVSSQDEDIENKVNTYLANSGLLEQATELGFANGAAMVQYYTQQVIEAQKAEESVYNKFDDLDTSGEETQKVQGLISQLERANGAIDLTTAQTKDLVDSLYQVAISGGNITQLMGYLNTAISGIDPSNMEQAMSYISSTNWYDENSVQSTLDALEELGAEIDNSLVASILKASNAVKTFNLEKFNQQLQNVENIRDKVTENIKNKETTYSKEDVDTFIELGLDTSDFFKTGFDEYTYIGEQESLLTSIDSKVGSILSEMTGDIDQAVARGEGLKAMFEEGSTWQNGLTEQQIVESIVGGAYGIGAAEAGQTGWVSAENARLLLSEMYSAAGITPDVDVNTMGPEAIQDAMATLMQYLYKLPENLQIQKQNNEDNLQQQYYQKDGSELLNIISTSEDAAAIELATEALAAQAAQAGVTANEIEYYKKKLQDSGESNENLEEKAMEMATRIKVQQTKINEASAAIGEYLEAMDAAAIGTSEYIGAMSGIPEQIEKAFGYEPSMEWVEDNLDLIKEWAAGSEEAGAKIWDNLHNKLVEAMNLSEAQVGQSISTMIDYLNAFSGTNVWAKAYLDNSGFMNAITDSENEAKAFADYLNGLGYEAVFEKTTKQVKTPRFEADELGRMVKTGWDSTPIDAYNIKWKPTGASNPWSGGTYNAPSNYTPKSGGGGGGGGGGGSESKKWENPYDEFYNTVELLNEELRKREQLERRYQKLLDKTNTKASDLVSNARDQLASLEFELKTRQNLLAGRERQMAEIEAKNSQYSSYAWYNEEKQVIEIDWNKMQALDGSTNEDFTSGLEDYVSKLEEQQGLIEDELDAIYDIEDAIWEIYDQGKDEYFDLEEQIKEALQSARQKEIDTLSAINDSINDTNSRLIDAMQSSIDQYRQDRENEKTEEELADKQRRLAYLQQDTSGANALEIMQLQKEIEEGQEDYTDTLIDQKISELQEQNDEAAEQRQHQIDLMQAQLDHYLESQEVWDDIYSLMNTGIGPDGIVAGSELENLLKESANFEGMSYLQKMDWLSELEDNVAKAVQWLMSGNSTEALIAKGELNAGETIKFTTADGEIVEGVLDEKGNVTTSTGEKYTEVYRTYNGALVTSENFITPRPAEPEPEPEPEEPEQTFTPPALTDEIKRGVAKAIINGNYGWGNGAERVNKLNEVFGANDIQRNYVNKGIYGGNAADYSYTNMRYKFKQYKTGGLADFTGPAWLDGTKSKPEYILNADQTKAFFSLVDVLEGLRAGTSHNTQNSGDSIYDIDINVESIGNDYDVEQMASTIKRMINDDARYRNNNAINLSR